MQRTNEGGIIISCDFCGTDWDPYDATFAHPMTEGHRGSVICLPCVQRALSEAAVDATTAKFECTMCLKTFTPEDAMASWRPDRPAPEPAGGNERAVICQDCIEQAARVFSKDPDIDWKWDRSGQSG